MNIKSTKTTGQGPEVKKNAEDDLQAILKESLSEPVEAVAQDIKKSSVSDAEVTKVINVLGQTFSLDPSRIVTAITLLFLKGAASNGTPDTLSVDVMTEVISKRDLRDAYKLVTGNTFLRRLAEAMAVHIGTYAEKNGLRGELANRIETAHRAATGESLTPKEQAWCSSFSQHLPDLAARTSDRLVKLLAEDYQKRFDATKAKNAAKSARKEQNKGAKSQKR